MFNTALHRKIAKQALQLENESIQNEKKNGTYHEIETPMIANNTLQNRLSGYEKEYQKQVPVIAGGRANMEIAEQVKPKMRQTRSRKVKSNLGMLYQDQLSQFKGSGEAFNDRESEIERDNLERAMGSGLTMSKAELEKDAQLNQLKAKMGGGSNKLWNKLPEVVEGSDLKLEVAEPKKKRGRKPKVAQVGVAVELLVEKRNNKQKSKSKSPAKKSKSKSPAKVSAPQGPAMKRRANKIKEIMKSMNKSMIEASKYIKENKIVY